MLCFLCSIWDEHVSRARTNNTSSIVKFADFAPVICIDETLLESMEVGLSLKDVRRSSRKGRTGHSQKLSKLEDPEEGASL